MPILSNSIVTRPLTEAERAESGLHSTTFITDTRTLRHYYRLLPDGSMQCGSRSSLTGADADNPVHLERFKRRPLPQISKSTWHTYCLFLVGLGRCES